jgi:hypothetical protein
MAYRRSRAEIISAACVPPLIKKTSELFSDLKWWHPNGPWTVAVFEPEDRKLIGRRHFSVAEEELLRRWFAELQPQFPTVQWFVASGKNAKS